MWAHRRGGGAANRALGALMLLSVMTLGLAEWRSGTDRGCQHEGHAVGPGVSGDASTARGHAYAVSHEGSHQHPGTRVSGTGHGTSSQGLAELTGVCPHCPNDGCASNPACGATAPTLGSAVFGHRVVTPLALTVTGTSAMPPLESVALLPTPPPRI